MNLGIAGRTALVTGGARSLGKQDCLTLAAEGCKVVVLDLGAVPALDATGLVGLESAVERLRKDHRQVVLARVQPQPLEVLTRASLDEKHAGVHFAPTLDGALELAGRLAG